MKKLHISYYKFFMLLVIIIAVCLSTVEATLIRRLLYIAAGTVFTARVRQEKVTVIEYFALIALICIIISLLFTVPILPFRVISVAILKKEGLYGIIHFLAGALLGYIAIPKK